MNRRHLVMLAALVLLVGRGAVSGQASLTAVRGSDLPDPAARNMCRHNALHITAGLSHMGRPQQESARATRQSRGAKLRVFVRPGPVIGV